MKTDTKYFDFENVRLIPKKGIVDSREECDTSVKFGRFTFKNPVIPANMLSCIDENLCIKLATSNYCYVHHRFNHNNIDFVRKMNEKNLLVSISVGVKEESYTQLKEIKKQGLNVDIICVDIAHGHSIMMEKTVKFIRDLGFESYIIGGNVCTEDAVSDLAKWGCSSAKVGIGPGSACTTFTSTNFGTRNWQASCIYHLSKSAEIPLICDGGIKTPGAISVAVAMGASMVMVGGMLSGFEDSPGSIIDDHGKLVKEFFGSASEYTKGHKKFSEGKKYLVEYKHGSLIDYFDTTINDGLKSAISYAGGKSLKDLATADWITV